MKTDAHPLPEGSSGGARRTDAIEVASRTLQFATPGTLVLLLFMGNSFVGEQIETDTQVRIHVEKIDSRLQSLERAEQDRQRSYEEERKAQSQAMQDLHRDVRSLRECVIAPRQCR